METHITPLEEEFNRILGYENGVDFISFTYSEKEKKLLELFKSREEKAREEGKALTREALRPFVYDRPIDKMLEEAREEGRKEEFNKICNSEKRFVESVITQYKEELLDKISKLKISNCYNDSTIFNHKDYVCLSEVKKLL